MAVCLLFLSPMYTFKLSAYYIKKTLCFQMSHPRVLLSWPCVSEANLVSCTASSGKWSSHYHIVRACAFNWDTAGLTLTSKTVEFLTQS